MLSAVTVVSTTLVVVPEVLSVAVPLPSFSAARAAAAVVAPVPPSARAIGAVKPLTVLCLLRQVTACRLQRFDFRLRRRKISPDSSRCRLPLGWLGYVNRARHTGLHVPVAAGTSDQGSETTTSQ